MATYPVKHLHSGLRGAPVLSGTAGTRISALDACLIDGFGAVSVSSISVAGGVATATVASGSWFEDGRIVAVSGATPAALNGEQRVLSHTATTFTYATDAPDGIATGTLSAKYAPVGGWQKLYSAANKAVYRSTDPQANGHCLRVDDSDGRWARVVAYESMTGIDAGTDAFPTAAQFAGGGYWHAYPSVSATACNWALFADSRFFMLGIAPLNYGYVLHGFGDLLPIGAAGDGWATALTMSANVDYRQNHSLIGVMSDSINNSRIVLARDQGGTSKSLQYSIGAYLCASVAATSGFTNVLGGFGGGANRLLLSRMYARGALFATAPRADIPGALYLPQSGVQDLVPHGSTLIGVGPLAGRTLSAVRIHADPSASTNFGLCLVDTTGPWR